MTRRTTTILCSIIGALLLFGYGTWWLVRQARVDVAALNFVATKAFDHRGSGASSAVIPALLGMETPRTILILFLNNTEIRPGGGFIGSYGVVTVDHGAVVSLFTDGTENLDRAAIALAPIAAPQPIKDHLIDRWFFRDSNWSPDFARASQDALTFYTLENGQQATAIQTVVGVTPEVLTTLMKYTGSVTAGGKVFTAENITDLLEQTVEVDFHKQGIPKTERKAVIGAIASELVSRIKHISPLQWGNVLGDFERLIDERHVIIFDRDSKIQNNLDMLGWSGRLKSGTPDSVMFVDANLASLKTDRVMERAMRYDVFRDAASGEWRGRVTMRYKNTGTLDWRTTRYGTYTRWYFPADTKFLDATGSVKSHKDKTPGAWDVTQEDGHTVIGSFILTEPGETTTVTIDIALAPSVVAEILNHRYGLLVQKQLGTHGFELTVHADFGTNVRTATPSESSKNFGDRAYDWNAMVTKDTMFDISFESLH